MIGDFGWFTIMFRGKKQYEPPRFMTINTAIEQLLEVVEMQGESGESSGFKMNFKVIPLYLITY